MNEESKSFQSHREAFPTNIISVLVCLVQWNDHEGRYLPDPNHFREMWNGESRTVANPGESISHWLQSNSYGKYSVRAEVLDWRRLNQSEAYWANGNMGNSDGDRTIEQAFVPLLEAAGKSGVNLKKFDINGDGYLKGVFFVHSGFGAELRGTDCYTGASYLDRIISKSWNTDVAIGSTGLRLSNFVTVSAYNNICNLGPAHIGVHIHEWLHSHFSLSDMYDLGGRYQDSQSAVGGLGAYDIMSFAGGQTGAPAFPGILSPYNKMEIGGFNPIEITTDGIYTARASEYYPDIYMISRPYPSGEYLLIENRQPVLSDQNLWKPGGILIYHVDENTGGNGNRVRGGPFVEDWPGNGAHYKVALLQADGKYELEQALNQGHIQDFWKTGDVLGPGNGELVATDAGTYPNTDSYVSGNIRITGLEVDQFTETESGVWSFRVSNLVPLPPSPPSTKPPSQQTPKPTASSQRERVNCHGPVFNDPSFYCDCMDDCQDFLNFICSCDEARACCATYLGSIDYDDVPSMSASPSLNPSSRPTASPTRKPSSQPSKSPSSVPSSAPSLSQSPSATPSSIPSKQPSFMPSSEPSFVPSASPSVSAAPSDMPSMAPTADMTMEPAYIAAIVTGMLFLLGMLILLIHRNQPPPVVPPAGVSEEEEDGIFLPREDDGLSSVTSGQNSYLSRLRYWGYPESLVSFNYGNPSESPPDSDPLSQPYTYSSSSDNYGFSL